MLYYAYSKGKHTVRDLSMPVYNMAIFALPTLLTDPRTARSLNRWVEIKIVI